MSLMDGEREELIRRRLTESVTKEVETRLFRYYRNALGLILSTLAVAGIAVGWPTLRSFIVDTVDSHIKAIVDQKVTVPVAEAEKLARDANAALTVSITDLNAQRHILEKSLARLHNTSEDIGLTYAKVNERVQALAEAAQDLEQKTTFFTEEYKTSLVTRDELQREVQAALIAFQTPLSALVDDLARVPELVQDLARGTEEGEEVAAASRDLVSIAEQTVQQFTQQQEQQFAQQQPLPPPEATVFVQFAGGSRDDIKRLTSILRDEGWQVPGEERLAIAAGKREVRYFHAGDEPRADDLVRDINLALEKLGFKVAVAKEGLLNYPKKPRPGILELWLEIPGR